MHAHSRAQHWPRTGPKLIDLFWPNTGPMLNQYRSNAGPVLTQRCSLHWPNTIPMSNLYQSNTGLVPSRHHSCSVPTQIPLQCQTKYQRNVETVLAQNRTNKFDVGPAPVPHWPVNANHLETHYLSYIYPIEISDTKEITRAIIHYVTVRKLRSTQPCKEYIGNCQKYSMHFTFSHSILK